MRRLWPASLDKTHGYAAIGVLVLSLLLPQVSRAAPGHLIVGSSGELRHAELSLARARTTRAVERIRDAFAKSRFGDCIALAHQAVEDALGALKSAGDFSGLRDLYLWRGACQAAQGDQQKAERSFRRARNIEGPAPDPRLFPPKFLKLYDGLVAANSCDVQLAPEIQQVGARAVTAESMSMQVGEHAFSAVDHSGLILVGDDCSTQVQRFRARAALREDEAVDVDFLLLAATQLKHNELILVTERGDLQRFNVNSRTLSPYTPAPVQEAAESPSVFASPVFWIIMGVAVVGSVGITAAAMSSSTEAPAPTTRIRF